MAKTLILARHSYAENLSYNITDFKRNLTPTGEQFIYNQALKFNKLGLKVDVFISSDAIRTRKTSEIISGVIEFKSEIKYEHFLYEQYTTQQFVDFLGTQNSKVDTLFIVGHNPTIANIAYRLFQNFGSGVKPGTIMVAEFDITEWNALEINSGKIIKVLE